MSPDQNDYPPYLRETRFRLLQLFSTSSHQVQRVAFKTERLPVGELLQTAELHLDYHSITLFLHQQRLVSAISVDGMDKRKYHCPDNFIRIANSCYYLSVYMDTWHNAQFRCQDMNSSLATPDRLWKDRRLKKLLNMEPAGTL